MEKIWSKGNRSLKYVSLIWWYGNTLSIVLYSFLYFKNIWFYCARRYLLGTSCILSTVPSKEQIKKKKKKKGREGGREGERTEKHSFRSLSVPRSVLQDYKWCLCIKSQQKRKWRPSPPLQRTLTPGENMTWWCVYVTGAPKPPFLVSQLKWNFILGGSGHSDRPQSLAFKSPPTTMIP